MMRRAFYLSSVLALSACTGTIANVNGGAGGGSGGAAETVDPIIPPTPTLTTRSSRLSPLATFDVDAAVAAQVLRFECNVGTSWFTCSSPFSITDNGSALPAGFAGSFKVRSVSPTGDVSPEAIKDFVLGYSPRGFGEGIDVVRALPGGKIFVANAYSYRTDYVPTIMRLNGDGSRNDAPDLGVGFDQHPISVSPADDGTGDLYLSGPFRYYKTQSALQVARIKADGSLVTSFNTGSGFAVGGSVTDPTLSVSVKAAPEHSGKVYVYGTFDTYRGSAPACLLRLNSDGSRDTSFNGAGAGFTGGGLTYIQSIDFADDGSGDLFAVGSFDHYNGVALTQLVRLHSDGTVVGTFSIGSGFASGGFPNPPHGVWSADYGNGAVYVLGDFFTYKGIARRYLVRLNGDGSLDSSFSVEGRPDSNFTSMVVIRDGSHDLYVGGWFSNYDGAPAGGLVRLNSDGSRDSSFAVGAGFDYAVFPLLMAPDGSGDLLASPELVGTYQGQALQGNLVRLKPNGLLDTSFKQHEVMSPSLVSDSEAKLWLIEKLHSEGGQEVPRVAELTPTGGLSESFNAGTGFDDDIISALPLSDGSLMVIGYFSDYNGTPANSVAKIQANGLFDPSFSLGAGFDVYPTAVTLASDGSGDFLFGGPFSDYQGHSLVGVARVHADGSPDLAFNNGNAGTDDTVNDIIAAPDNSGDFYVGGDFSTYNTVASARLVRIHGDGSREPSFAVGAGFVGSVRHLLAAPDNTGDVYVGGTFTTYQGSSANRLIRLRPDGTRAPGFALGTGFDAEVKFMVPAPDNSGDIYVGGRFTSYQGNTARRIVRLKSDGTIASSFNTGIGFDGIVSSLTPATDGSTDIFVGGFFSAYNGLPRLGIARLKSDGSAVASFEGEEN